jgi:type I restriction enzyme S subunit
MISHLRISFPSISEQEDIAWVLKSLDDKIQLNRRMNTTLEAMAQALFKSWFVDFDPVIDKALAAGNPISEPLRKRAEARQALGDKRKPLPADVARHFPDRFVFNEEMGWVPEGWEVGKFADIARHVRSSVKADEVEGYDFYVGLEHIGKKNLFLYNNGSGASVSSNKSGFEEGDLLFGKLRPYFHKVCIAPCQGICSTDILVLRAKSSSLHSYMMLTAFTEKFVDYANLRSTGTRMPRANVKDMLEYAITLPSKKILDSFDGSLAPMWKKGMASVKNGQNLATLRDTLLPKLLSGQLRIPDAEKIMNDA